MGPPIRRSPQILDDPEQHCRPRWEPGHVRLWPTCRNPRGQERPAASCATWFNYARTGLLPSIHGIQQRLRFGFSHVPIFLSYWPWRMHSLRCCDQDLGFELVSILPASTLFETRAVRLTRASRPHHRGTATAFPLAAFGLSAFFFSLIGGFLFPGDTSDFLLLLACGTAGLTFLGFWFLRVVPHGTYQSVATEEDGKIMDPEEAPPRRGSMFEPGKSSPPSHTIQPHTKANALHKPQAEQEYGVQAAAAGNPFDLTSGRTASGESSTLTTAASSTIVAETDDSDDETSSLVSRASSVAGEVYVEQNIDLDRSHHVDIRGWQIIRNLEFWQLFAVMGILAGIGLMTIK